MIYVAVERFNHDGLHRALEMDSAAPLQRTCTKGQFYQMEQPSPGTLSASRVHDRLK